MMGIYILKNNTNNKVYVGQSINLEKRFYIHEYLLNKGQHHNCFLQNAWVECGSENFSKEVLEIVEDCKILDEREKYYIKHFKSNDCKFGYNLTEGGEDGKRNLVAKERISVNGRGKNTTLTEDDVRKIKMAMWCGIDRKEISEMFGVSTKVLTAISQGLNFYYVLPYLNEDLYRAKEKAIAARNRWILETFDSLESIAKTARKTGYSVSIVEKCVYKYRNSVQEKREQYQQIYEKVWELYRQGYSKSEITEKLGIGVNTTNRYLSGENNPYKELPFKKVTEKMKEEIISQHINDGVAISKLAKDYNVSRNTIESVLSHFKYVNTEINLEIKASKSS